MKAEQYEEIAKRFAKQIENGGAQWKKPWTVRHMHHNEVSGHQFTGWNPFWCTMSSIGRFTSSSWATKTQWRKVNASIKPDQVKEGTMLLRPLIVTKTDDSGKEKRVRVGWADYFVYNEEQVDGYERDEAQEEAWEPVPSIPADTLIRNSGAEIHHGGDVACYIPSVDKIMCPERKQFLSDAHYYATVFHELGHWTKHADRLDRTVESYAKEELVAELCSAFLCAETDVACTDTDESHVGYLASWSEMKGDEIIKSVGLAQAAAHFVTSAKEDVRILPKIA